MHPELLRALADARYDDLLNERRPRRSRRTEADDRSPPFRRSRQRVGSLLVSAGARLIGDQGAALGLARK
jgi:hypothetical protein